MSTPTHAQRLMIYLGESDSWRGRSLYMSILETLRKSDIAGATVTRAIAGFGAHSRIRTDRIEVLSFDLPIVITVIDTPTNIERALRLIGPMVREGLITLEDLMIVKYTHRYLQPLPADLPIAEIMTRDVATVTPDTPARQVAELLLGKMFKAVPVIDEEYHVVGIISDGDLLHYTGMPARLAVGERLEAGDLRYFLDHISDEKTAQDIMTAPVVTANERDTLGHIGQKLLERGLKRLPVVNDQDKLVGMLSRLDILRATAGSKDKQQERGHLPHPGQTLGEIMSTQVPTVYANDDLSDILRQLLQAEAKHEIVLDEQGKAVGIITEGDLVARVSPTIRRGVIKAFLARVVGSEVSKGHATARDLMSENVLSAPKETTVVEAIELLLRDGRKRIVVIDAQGYPVGIVDRQILMAASLGHNSATTTL